MKLITALPGRIGWLVILAGALGVSGWSLYFVATQFGVPPAVAVFSSACFDGVAYLAADYGLRELKDDASDSWPRAVVWLFAGLSAFLNSWHATLAGNPSFARVFWAVPPVSAVIVYDLHLRRERRKAMARAGKAYPRPLPSWGALTWFLFPLKTTDLVRDLTKDRMSSLAQANKTFIIADTVDRPAKQPKSIANETMPNHDTNVVTFGRPKPKIVRAWARDNGYEVSDRARLPNEIWDAYAEANGEPT